MRHYEMTDFVVVEVDTTIIDTTIITLEYTLSDTVKINEVKHDTVFQDKVRIVYEKLAQDVLRVEATCIPDTITIDRYKIKEVQKAVKGVEVEVVPRWVWILIGVMSPGFIYFLLFIARTIIRLFI